MRPLLLGEARKSHNRVEVGLFLSKSVYPAAPKVVRSRVLPPAPVVGAFPSVGA